MDKEKRLSTDDVKFIQVEMTENDEIMVDVIDNALDYLDKYSDFFSEPITVKDMRDWIKSKLPFKESEDEKMRKGLIGHLKECRNQCRSEVMISEYAKWIAWLEKQCELINSLSKGLDNAHERIDELIQKNNSLIVQLEKQGEQKLADKVELKFKVGDWVVDNCGHALKIKGIINQFYLLESVEGGGSWSTIEWVNMTFHIWTVKDAKDGDVLATPDGNAFIFWGFLDKFNPGKPVAHCGLDCEGHFLIPSIRSWRPDQIAYPATKEERDLLFSKMKEAGYKIEQLKIGEI